MRTKLRSKVTLLFMTCAVLLAIPAIALADDFRNNLDTTFDANFEVVSLQAGQVPTQTQTVNIVLQAQGSDNEGGCNVDAGEGPVTVKAKSSNSSVASVKWATTGNDTVNFTDCAAPNSKNLVVTAGSAGSANVTFEVTNGTATATPGVYTVSSTGSGTYDVRTAQFTVNVTPPPNNPPSVSVTGVEHGATYEYNAVPDAGCNVIDAEDTDESATPEFDSSGLNAYGLGLQKVTCSYTDNGPGDSLTETASATYTIVDTTNPVLDLPANITREATSSAGAEVDFSADVSATDELYGSVDVTCDPPSGTFALGTTTVNCSATDGSGNTAEGSFTVTVEDTTAPVLDLPANITEEATSSAGAEVNYSATAEDAVDGSFDADCAPASGATFPLGTTTVDCSATDAAGNTSTGSFDVTVEDTTAPTLSLPANIVKEATGPSGAAVTYSATASDLVDGNMGDADCTPASGATFPITTTTVNCSATDAAGNEATGSFTVKVQDTTGPALSLPANITTTAPSNSAATVNFTATANDLVDGSRPVTCMPPSGSSFPVGTTTVQCSSSDTRNNTSTGSFSVTVNYNWTGFFQPIDNKDSSGNYILNKAKAGSVVPVKFSLGGDQGLNVLASGYPQTATIPCTASSTDALEEYGTGNVSSFKYDPVANQYIYNWKTDTKWAGSCRQLVVKLADGTYHRANFNFFK